LDRRVVVEARGVHGALRLGARGLERLEVRVAHVKRIDGAGELSRAGREPAEHRVAQAARARCSVGMARHRARVLHALRFLHTLRSRVARLAGLAVGIAQALGGETSEAVDAHLRGRAVAADAARGGRLAEPDEALLSFDAIAVGLARRRRDAEAEAGEAALGQI